MIKKIITLIKEEKGQALILVALSMVVLTGVAALSVDYGYLAWQKRDLQNAADAAALAAAWDLPNGDYQARANEYVSKYIDISEMPTTVTTTKLNNKAVRVEIHREYNTLFAKVLGINSSEVYAMAEAEKDSWYTGLLPFALRDDYVEEELPEGWMEGDPIPVPVPPIDDMDEYVDFMEDLIGDNINLWGKEDDENLKFGLVKLGEFSYPYKINTSPKDVIEAGLDKSIFGEDLYIGSGLDHSIADALEGKNNPKPEDYAGFLNLSGGEGYIIGVLPSRAAVLTNSTGSDVIYWGEYVILHFVNLDYTKEGNVHLSGTLKHVYNISDPDFSEEDFSEDFFIGKSSKLIK
jgi:hypothetical protein